MQSVDIDGPFNRHGFRSAALNTKIRRLPDGLSRSLATSITHSPIKVSALSQKITDKYLPTAEEINGH